MSGALYRFFERNLRQVFSDLRLGREALPYLAGLLTRFARTDALYRVRGLPGSRLESVVEALVALSDPPGGEPMLPDDELLVRRHIGDFTLFMCGIFREYVQRHGYQEYYTTEGKRQYLKVAETLRRDRMEQAECFSLLSNTFEQLAGALDYLRKVYLHHPEVDTAIRRMLSGLE